MSPNVVINSMVTHVGQLSVLPGRKDIASTWDRVGGLERDVLRLSLPMLVASCPLALDAILQEILHELDVLLAYIHRAWRLAGPNALPSHSDLRNACIDVDVFSLEAKRFATAETKRTSHECRQVDLRPSVL